MDDITINVTSSITSSNRRISPQWSLKVLKKKLFQITGIPVDDQRLYVYKFKDSNERSLIDSKTGSGAGSVDEDLVILSELGVMDGGRIHVENTNLNNVELVELERDILKDLTRSNKRHGGDEDEDDDCNEEDEGLFKLSEERYSELSKSVKSWKIKNQLGEYNPQTQEMKQQLKEKRIEVLKNLEIGSRVKINNTSTSDGGVVKVGTVKYIGLIPEIPKSNSKGEEGDNGDIDDDWVGVELDEPLGKNDGSIKGKRYFTCLMKYGVFIRPNVLEIGEFPVNHDEFIITDSEDDEL